MNTATPRPKVEHHILCACAPCGLQRENRLRIEDARREAQREAAAAEELAGREGALAEALPRPQPGTRIALVRRYGGAA